MQIHKNSAKFRHETVGHYTFRKRFPQQEQEDKEEQD